MREHCPAGDREELVAVRVRALEPVLGFDVVGPLRAAVRADRISVRPSGTQEELPAAFLTHLEDIMDAQRAAGRILQPVLPLLLALEWFGCTRGH